MTSSRNDKGQGLPEKPPLKASSRQAGVAADHCFLSEFGDSLAGRFFRAAGWYWKLAAATVLLAALILFVGHHAGANALNIQIVPSVKSASGAWVQLATLHVLHGYLVETNHAFYYLTLAPAFVVVGGLFLKAAQQALVLLQAQRRIRRRSGKADVLAYVARKNRQWCRWAIFTLPLLGLVAEMYVEIPSYCQVKNGTVHNLGYVQAPFLADWQAWFDSKTSEQARYAIIKPLAKSDLETRIKAYLQSAPPAVLVQWAHDKALTLTAFPQQQADISELLPGEVQKGLFKLDLNAAAQKELFSLQVHCVKGSKKEAVAWHWLFLILVFVLEGLFHAYVAWMVIKSVFWLWIVWKLLPGFKNWSYQFRPLLQDPRKHFGLFELHRPYNYIMLQMLIGAFVLALAFASNVAKEVSGDLGAELHSFLGTVLIAVSIFIPGTLVFFGPMFYFDRRMSGLQQKFVQRLDARLAKDQDQKKVIAIEAEKQAISSQTCWPHENKQFKFLAVAILIFVAMPVLLSLPHVPKEVESYLSAVKLCQSFMHAVADWFYSLTQA